MDTSALAAIVLGESDAEVHAEVVIRHAGACVVSAPTLVETEIVVEAQLGTAGPELLTAVLQRISIEVMPFDATLAQIATAAWRRFGKGRHPAALNFGDCFSYALARQLDAPLLFKGDNFSQTDLPAHPEPDGSHDHPFADNAHYVNSNLL